MWGHGQVYSGAIEEEAMLKKLVARCFEDTPLAFFPIVAIFTALRDEWSNVTKAPMVCFAGMDEPSIQRKISLLEELTITFPEIELARQEKHLLLTGEELSDEELEEDFSFSSNIDLLNGCLLHYFDIFITSLFPSILSRENFAPRP